MEVMVEVEMMAVLAMEVKLVEVVEMEVASEDPPVIAAGAWRGTP